MGCDTLPPTWLAVGTVCGYGGAMSVRFGTYAGLCLLALGLSGCSSRVETRIRSDGAGVAGTPLLMWQAEADDAAPDPLLARVKEAVAGRLQERGFRFADQAPVMLSIGVAERPGGIALQTRGDEALSPAPKRGGLFPCQPRLIRLTVSMTDSATGRKLYGGSAEEAHCRAAFDQVMPRLAETALADLATPRGQRTEISPIPD